MENETKMCRACGDAHSIDEFTMDDFICNWCCLDALETEAYYETPGCHEYNNRTLEWSG